MWAQVCVLYIGRSRLVACDVAKYLNVREDPLRVYFQYTSCMHLIQLLQDE